MNVMNNYVTSGLVHNHTNVDKQKLSRHLMRDALPTAARFF